MKQTKLPGALAAQGKAKRGSKLISTHLERFGLKVCTRNANTSHVDTIVCRFCLAFGREANDDSEVARGVGGEATRARKSTTRPKYFNVFRSDLFEKHLKNQHLVKWTEYQAISSPEAKAVFFQPTPDMLPTTLRAAFAPTESLKFIIRQPIVDVVIGQLLFHPDDLMGTSHKRALSIFHLEGTNYTVTEKNVPRFRLAVRFMGRGATFRMTAGMLDDTKTETGMARYAGASEGVVARYARIVCAASLEQLARHVGSAWAFSIALDCATHQGKSYVDVRSRHFACGKFRNFHLIAIPLFERHTAANIFSVVKKFFDALMPTWRRQLLGVATDGAATMTGCVGGLVTLIEKETEHGVTRVWCGLHQLDLKMEIVFQVALDKSYLCSLTALIGYLRRQQNLISEMRTTCPKVANTRWLSMYQVTDWLCSHSFKIREYLEEKKAVVAPNKIWWIFLFGLREVAREANAVFVSLQGLSTLIQQQTNRFSGLVKRFCDLSGAAGPIRDEEVTQIDTEKNEIIGNFVISHDAAHEYVKGLDMWVYENLGQLENEERKGVVVAVARMYLVAVNGVYDLVEAVKSTPPVTPTALAKSKMAEIADMINLYKSRLLQSMSEADIYRIAEEFQLLKRSYDVDLPFRSAMDAFDCRLATFDAMWAVGDCAQRFPTLATFCGGVATVFPNTATVESDFSIVNSEKSDKRWSLTDLALEGILHCKQWERLRALPE